MHGIAVKVEDGTVSVLYAVAAELLGLLEIGTAGQRAKLDAFRAPKRVNTMGVETGRLAFSIGLAAAR